MQALIATYIVLLQMKTIAVQMQASQASGCIQYCDYQSWLNIPTPTGTISTAIAPMYDVFKQPKF